MEKQLPQWVFRPQFLFFVFFVCFFSIAIQLKSRKWKTKLRLTSNKQSLTWLVLTPAPLVDILSVRDYFYPDNLLYPHINIYIYIYIYFFFFFFFFFFFSSSQLFTHVLQIFSLGKLVQVTHRRKNSTVNFPLSLSNFANISFSYFFDISINLRPLSLCYTKKMFMFESESPLRRHLYLKHYKQNSFLIFFLKSTSLLTSYSNSYSKSDENKEDLSYTTLQR